MLKVRLVNLPFTAYHLPSLGLTQLRSVTRKRFPGRVDIEVVYANHDFANYFGLDFYEEIKGAGRHLTSGMAEWLFAAEAFPEAPDNTEEFFLRYYPSGDEATSRFKTRILDKRAGLGRILERVIDKYRLHEADIVGCTSMFFENNVSIALARRLKERRREIVTLLGGANCESPSGEELARQVPQLDYVFSGSSLISFPNFLECQLSGDLAGSHAINGVFSAENCGIKDPDNPKSRFVKVGHMGEILNINEDIPLEYEGFLESLDESFPEMDIKAVIPFETSRGCWWGEHSHCTFCGLNKSTMSYVAMEPQRAIELISSLFEYSDRASVIMCVDNILQRDYVDKVFPYLDTPESNSIFYQLKANLTEREIEAMSRARVKSITPGFESLATSTLKLMAKGVTSFHNIRVMKYCLMHDVFPGWNLLIGSPGEGEEVYEKYTRDLPLLVHLPPPQAVFNIKFNRYSPYFMFPEQHGLSLEPSDHYQLVYPFDKHALRNVAYDFQDTNVRSEYRLSMAKWVDRLQGNIDAWRDKWYGEGQLMPKLFTREEDGRTLVYDSRFGEEAEYQLTEGALLVLGALERHQKVARLHKDKGLQAAGVDVDREVERLLERRLLFQEDDSLMSLVLPYDPPPMTFHTNGLGIVRQRRTAAKKAQEPALVRTARQRRRVKKIA